MYQGHDESFEFYTPRVWIDRAERVFGRRVELDPASSKVAQQTVQAERYAHIEEGNYDRAGIYNGLLHGWKSPALWINPPYRRGLIEAFTAKLIVETDMGTLGQAMALLPARTDTAWFRPFFYKRFALCFLHGRIRFNNDLGYATQTGGKFPSVIAYYGLNFHRFYDEFEPFGAVCPPGSFTHIAEATAHDHFQAYAGIAPPEPSYSYTNSGTFESSADS